ncbi:tetratricopeptide repeat protein [Polaribacter vadi]|uniref:tetratricopeptide repeat protein n=1 Tax=Polaribacter TaxID=52959 RepID=UPI001C0A491A|nr:MULTISPECIES: tetratricopeptide repeat protein [Polaribacter]MBU3010104.1 tetratricopeptide repeat protein [Polaribacter vadi]MDO6739911.1 tetratricopeptide repeat protein [Polaribacter sp. 1_MG-2023]
MFYKIIILFLFLTSLTVNAQDLDSVFTAKKEVVNLIKTDEEKIKFLYECGEFFYNINIAKSEYFYAKALSLNKDKSNTMKGRALFKLGLIEKKKGNLSTSLRYLNIAKDIFEKTNDFERLASVTFDIAYVYRYKKQEKKEFEYYKKAFKFTKKGDKKNLGKGFLYLGNYYTRQKKLDSSIYFYEKALNIFKILNRDDRVYNVYNNLANTYYKQGRYKEIISLRSLVLQYAKKENNQLLITVNYHNIAAAYIKMRNYKIASIYLDSSISIAEKENLKIRLSKSYNSLAKVNYDLKNYKKAYLYHQKHKIYSDSIFKSQILNTLKETELQSKLKIENKNLQILKQEQDFDKKLYLSLISVFLLLGIPLLLLFHRNSVNKNKIIQADLDKEKIKKEVLAEKFKGAEVEIKSLVADNSMRLEFLKQLLMQLKNQRKSNKSLAVKNYIKDLSFKIQQQITIESKLTLLKKKIGSVNDGFDSLLINAYKDLTKTEREVCALLRLNLSIKEIASIRNSNSDAIKAIRYRIRKKMNVPKDQKLERFIQNLIL